MESSYFPEEAITFTQELISGVMENEKRIDDTIRIFVRAWPFEQMAIVDRNILRLGIYEILFNAVLVKVAINKAIEPPEAFGNNRSPKFTNGVLGSVYTEIAKYRNLPGRG